MYIGSNRLLFVYRIGISVKFLVFFLQRQCNMFDFCIISGYWLLYCPLTNHQYLGMDLVIQEGEVEQMPPLPPNFPICNIFRFN